MLKPFRTFLNFIQNGNTISTNMNHGIVEEVVDETGYNTVVPDNPPYDPLAAPDTLNNNNEFSFEDIELNLTGSVIKTIHASKDKDVVDPCNVKVFDAEDMQVSDTDETDVEKSVVIENFEDLEELIKCEKIEIKKLETRDESDILSEIDENFIENETPKETDILPAILPVSAAETIGAECIVNTDEKLNEKQTPPEPIATSTPKPILSETTNLEPIVTTTTTTTTTTELQVKPSTAVATTETTFDDITEGEEVNCEEELRSDGSDSGLGSEPSHNSSSLLVERSPKPSPAKTPTPPSPPPVVQLPPKSSLKRRSSVALDNDASASGGVPAKRQKRNIQFDGVTVYYFPRQQGFSCVPSQGGCSLGMANAHNQIRYYTLAEHSAEQRKHHRMQLAEMNPRSSSSEETDSDEEPSESSSDADSEANGFLQPVTAKQRRTLLKAAGVRKIDSTEKDDCRLIRTSREVCGCTCRVYCDPETCACSQGGIKCQVDRQNFPCGCTRDGCGNVVGRVEFNPVRVRTHYIHTVMRLEMEKKQEKMQSLTPIEYQQPAPQWRVPAQNMSMCDFNLLYSNGQATPTPVMDRTRTVQPESLDLHYAYRDDYTPPTTYPSSVVYDPYPSTSTAPYLDPAVVIEQTPAIVPYDTGHFSIHSYAPEMQPRVAATTYDQYTSYYEQIPRKSIETPPVEPPPPATPLQNSYINLGEPVSSPTRLDAINTLLDTNRFNPTEPIIEQQEMSHDPNENLSEIIKKSIVETVSV